MIINIILTGVVLVALAGAWAWLAFVGIPGLVAGVLEVRENWDNDAYWTHPDDEDYWDNELHTLLMEETEPLDAWPFVNNDESVPVYETWPDWLEDNE